jgi:hypothetical protein
MNPNTKRVVQVLLVSGLFSVAAGIFNWKLVPLVLVLSLLTLSPMLRRKRIWFVGDIENEHQAITRRREEALRALKDLEEDFLAGKLERSEYEQLRPKYLGAAKELTTKLDEITERRQEARRRIEQDLASHHTGK